VGRKNLGPSGAVPVTVLGYLRREIHHAREHQQRVAVEWDRTLTMLGNLDFHAVGPGEPLEDLRGEVEIWNDLTLDPIRRISGHEELRDLPRDRDERFEYLHRVFVGMDPRTYSAMCDKVEAEVGEVSSAGAPVPMPQLRDRVVELMEVGVRCSARCIEWLEKRYKDVDLDR
jgi:hypothetical protein